jgi:predicted phosphodiesterase
MAFKYIRIASDLHLEGFMGRNIETLCLDFLPKDDRDADSILVLAGDISSQAEQLLGFLNESCKRFRKVYYVAGNHEFYKHDYDKYPKELLAAINNRFMVHGAFQGLETAFTTVNYEELEDDKLRFIFGPLWGDGGPTLADQGQTGFYLNDFRLITKGVYPGTHTPRKFTVQDMMHEYKKQKKEIAHYLNQPFDGRTVVITHHLPSRRLVSKRFWPGNGSDGANGGFVGDCDNLIATKEPWLWIHGHTHDTIDTELWKTRVVCNPAGYRGEWASPFNTFMTSERREDGTLKAIVGSKFVDL